MTDSVGARTRFQAMTAREFEASVQRDIPQQADRLVARGLVAREVALQVSAEEFKELLPQGIDTPGWRFLHILDEQSGDRVGEVWFRTKQWGGKTRFWVDWVWIDPLRRRRGYAADALRQLEEVATGLGADSIGLNVHTDNPGAQRLYAKLGYSMTNMTMAKSLPPRPLDQ